MAMIPIATLMPAGCRRRHGGWTTETQRRQVFTLKQCIDAGRHLQDAFYTGVQVSALCATANAPTNCKRDALGMHEHYRRMCEV